MHAQKTTQRETVVFLDENQDIVIDYNSDLDNFLEFARYKKDYQYGDLIALAIRTDEAVGFSHWHIPSGGDPDRDKEPVYVWKSKYKIKKKWRVGRGGRFIPVD